MERIEIKDFVGIKDITLDVKPINILIGPQASGKSVVAKLLFYFKSFISEIINAAERSKTNEELDQDFKSRFYEYFPSSSWGNTNFRICYYVGEDFIEISRKRKAKKSSPEVVLNYSAFFKDEFVSLKTIIQKQNEKAAEQDMPVSVLSRFNIIYDIERSFLRDVAKKVPQVVTFSQLYIPAGRSFFANLKSSIFTFLSENKAVDPFLVEFGNYYESVKNPIRLERLRGRVNNKQLNEEIDKLSTKILCGKYFQEDGEDYLEMDAGRKISVLNSSSGQQEVLPLALILRSIALSKPTKIGGQSIYIEEPEAHIFPAAQRDMVELISTVYNSSKDNLQFFITTHSPYILTAFNNLLQAGFLAANATEEKKKEIARYVPTSRFLEPNDLAVYSLADGDCHSILDLETGLIDTNIIDDVSNELAIQFDQLLDINP
ncbi:MAG: AAA family ATPase [Coleofasciculus sp. D1-CHI-01]|uniref:AAA family ATPase n=1 Tax=Coleofasciculus sp. D1-CHI-01 TaxID=3068482 RepID=UPI0032F40C0B